MFDLIILFALIMGWQLLLMYPPVAIYILKLRANLLFKKIYKRHLKTLEFYKEKLKHDTAYKEVSEDHNEYFIRLKKLREIVYKLEYSKFDQRQLFKVWVEYLEVLDETSELDMIDGISLLDVKSEEELDYLFPKLQFLGDIIEKYSNKNL